jgi:hypothetical protein
MANPHAVDAARELAGLSLALADALESGDLTAAEALVVERGKVLTQALAEPWPAEPLDVGALAEAQIAVAAADERSKLALARGLEATHAELATLARGSHAARAYASTEPLAPGYVDRHD